MTGLGALLRHPYLRHLRLNFNLLLSPIFLWGVLLAGGRLTDWRVWLAYVSLHVFLYGGTSAFNSYFDDDEGPIGGLLEPPPIDRGLLRFSLITQALGLPLALAVGLPFTAAWLLLFVLATAYSHPRLRLKADPAAALLAVALGQGGVGFVAGWLAVRPAFASLLGAPALWGAVTTALILTGLYLVSQSYQAHEDRRRGDRTLPVLLGPRRALLLAAAALGVGGAIMLAFVRARYGWGWTLLLLIFFSLLGAWLLRWAARFDDADEVYAIAANFRTAMRFAAVSAGGLSAFLVWQLLG